MDSSASSLGLRIRDAIKRKAPYVAVIGGREAANGHLALRLRDGRSLTSMPVDNALGLVSSVVDSRSALLMP